MKYKIIKSKNILDTTVKASEIETKFTIGEFMADTEYNKKKLTEIEAMMTMEKAKMTNIKNNHPEVLELDKKVLVGAYLYYQSLVAVKESKEKMKQINSVLKQSAKDRKEIEKQTGFSFKDIK